MESILEGNILIAEFMGKPFEPWNKNHKFNKRFNKYADCEKWIVKKKLPGYHPEIGFGLKCGKYNSSWDWLMPVVEKINKTTIPASWLKSSWDLGVDFHIWKVGSGCVIGDNDLFISDSGINSRMWNNSTDTMLNNTYRAVTEFIKWYNTQPKTDNQ